MARGVSVGPNGPTFELPPSDTPEDLYLFFLAILKSMEKRPPSNPPSGSFKITNMYVDGSGTLQVETEDTAAS